MAEPRLLQEIPPEWQRLINLAERMKFGDMTITFTNGKPVLVKNLQQNIKLDQVDDLSTHIL